MNEYTPTTQKVEDRYWLATVDDEGIRLRANEEQCRAEFRAWLAEHDAKVRAEEREKDAREPSEDPCPEWQCPDLSSEDRREGKTCPDHPCTCTREPSDAEECLVCERTDGTHKMSCRPQNRADAERYPFKAKVKLITDGIYRMLSEKNDSYGNSALDPVKIFSKVSAVDGIKVRIDDKLSRIARGSEYPGDDTINDLIGYLVLYRIAQDGLQEQT